jgi:DNA-binding NtrC family response regulator
MDPAANHASSTTATLTNKQRIFIIDDDNDIRTVLRDMLVQESDLFAVEGVGTGAEALKRLRGPREDLPDLILLDHSLPDMAGTDLQKQMTEMGVYIPVIYITGMGRASSAILATQLGAVDYLTKPFDDPGQVIDAINRALALEQKRRDNATAEIPEVEHGEKFIGRGPEMMHVFTTVGLAARTPSTILITGETGTGKSMVAEMIHQVSDRRRGPFVSVHCAGIPETLLEGELFGYEAGAFTGATKRHIGRFETANGGTIFLDEIGEMTLATQSKLLKVLQNKEIERLGSSETIKVDVRIITATHRNLALMVREGHFREDLFFRLHVIPIHMPSLRERKGDLPALVAHFLKMHRLDPAMPPASIAQEALDKLEAHEWPGNVRELENVLQRAVVYSRGDLIMPEHIVFTTELDYMVLNVSSRLRQGATLEALTRELQQIAMQIALQRCEGQPYRAADMLGMDIESFEKLRGMLGI